MIERRVIVQKTKRHSDRNKPTTTKWKGVTMVRNHSFLSTVKEIINYSEEMDVVRVGIIGDMHSGKSTLSQSIGHAIHKYSKIPFSVRVFFRDDLRNFKKTVKNLTPANYVLIFDDVSFMKDTAVIEQEISEIRHMEGGQDVKIVLVFNFHYPKALPPFLREFQFKYITSIGTDSERVIAENYGKNNVKLILDFKLMRKKAITKKMWFERVGPKDPVKYNWRNPFQPVLFWNEQSIRKIVSPTRYFMDSICSICDEGEGNKVYDDKTLPEILAQGEKNFTKGNFLAAIKLLLHTHGLTTYGKNVVRSIRWLEKERKKRNIPLSAIATHYGLTETNTRLRAKPFDESS